MLSTIILLTFLSIATVTDVRRGKIHNWTTYPATLIALVLNLIGTIVYQFVPATTSWEGENWHGTIGIGPSLIGFFACGMLMLVCYVFFPREVGGGDVKLLAMIGAFMGVYDGFETLLWTFILTACLAIIVLIWEHGVFRIIGRCLKYIMFWIRLGGMFPLTDEDRKPLRKQKYLAPGALAGAVIVHFHLVEWM